MKSTLCSILFLACGLFTSETLASSFDRSFPTRNDHLREQLENSPHRLLPKNKYVYWAVDAEFFYMTAGNYDRTDLRYRPLNPYHGDGYWIENRLELIPIEQVRLNLKTVPYYGTMSYGYGAAAKFFLIAGLTFEDQIGESSWKYRLRVVDLGMQTFGLGTVVEERPMSGAFMEVETGDLRIRQTEDGTGTLRVSGEMYDTHVSFQDEIAYVGLLHYQRQKGFSYRSMTNFYAGSRLWFQPSSIAAGSENGASSDGSGAVARDYLGVEVVKNSYNWAALAKARFSSGRNDRGRWSWVLEPSIRHYGDGFAGDLARNIEQSYTGYDLQATSYTNAINIFRLDDNVTAPALRTWTSFRLNRWSDLFVDQEIGKWMFKDRANESYHFWNIGMRFYPIRERNDYFSFSMSNKLLTAYNPSTSQSVLPDQADEEANKPRFVENTHFVVTVHGSF